MIRRSLWVVAAFCALAGSGVSARQSVDDLIAKNLEAKGGLEKLKAIQSIKQVNTFNMQGMEGSMTVFTKRPNRLRQEMKLGGQTVINGFDGVTPWTINPLVGFTRAVAVTGPQADMVREQGDFDGPLVDYKAKGHTVELLGKEPVEGSDAYKLKVTLKNGSVRTIWIDAEANLEIKGEGKRTIRGSEVESETALGDYKEVGGVMYPHSVEGGPKGVPQRQKIVIDKIEVNPTLDDSRFKMPEVKKEEPPKAPEKPKS